MIRALSTRELLSMKRFEELLEHLNNLKLISEWQFGEMLPRSAGRGELRIWLPPAPRTPPQATRRPLWENRQCGEVQVQPGNRVRGKECKERVYYGGASQAGSGKLGEWTGSWATAQPVSPSTSPDEHSPLKLADF